MPRFIQSLQDRIQALTRRTMDLKHLGTSWSARLSRVWGGRMLMLVGTVASVYALFLFATDALAPNAPSQAHDTILKSRFSGPAPARNILIIDIDERSLALLAPEHGRWPWPRSVLADGAQKLSDLGARSILFNVLTSDADKANADSDAALDFTAQSLRAMAFPMVRLNPENDAKSQLKVSAIAGAQTQKGQPDATVAAILPLFGGMQDRLGVSNQRPDDDGVVRQYPLTWTEKGYTLPSLVGRTLEVAGVSTADLPAEISLNWRNKKGRYQRISFADLLSAPAGDPRLSAVAGAIVVMGVSAPGLGPTKPTSVSPVEDDNEILATALDDALNKTWLRVMPSWVTLLINLGAIWILIALAVGKLRAGKLTQVFLLAQSGLGAITLLSASYSHYLVDLSESMSFAVAVFGVIKLVQSLDDSWSRAKPGFRRVDAKQTHQGSLTVISFHDGDVAVEDLRALQRDIESVVGVSRLIRIDDLFAGESILQGPCSSIRCLLVLEQDNQQTSIEQLLEGKPFHGKLLLDRYELQTPWNPEDPALAAELAPLVLQNSAHLLRTVRG